MPSKTNDVLAAVIAAPRGADIARVLGKDGKAVRDFTRKTLGVYVSQGGTLDDRAKRFIYARFVGNVSTATLAQAWADGSDAPTQ